MDFKVESKNIVDDDIDDISYHKIDFTGDKSDSFKLGKIDLSIFNPKKSYETLKEHYQKNKTLVDNFYEEAKLICEKKKELEKLYEPKNIKVRMKITRDKIHKKVKFISEEFNITDNIFNPNTQKSIGSVFKSLGMIYNQCGNYLIITKYDSGIVMRFFDNYIHGFVSCIKTKKFKYSYYLDYNLNLIGYHDPITEKGELYDYELYESHKSHDLCEIKYKSISIDINEFFSLANSSYFCFYCEFYTGKLYCKKISEDETHYDEINDTYNIVRFYEISCNGYKNLPKFHLINPTNNDIINYLGEIMKKNCLYYSDGSTMYDGEYFISRTMGKIRIDYDTFNKIKHLSETTILEFINSIQTYGIEKTTTRGSFKRAR